MRDLSPIGWAILPLKKYAVFSGRAPRAEYWWFYLATVVVQIPLTLIDKLAGNLDLLSTIYSFAILLPWLGVTVRRLHDTDRSGWWLLGLLGGFVLIGIMMVVGVSGLATGSTAGSFTVAMLALLIALGVLITYLVFMVLPGTTGPNRYGPDPYGPGSLEEVFA